MTDAEFPAALPAPDATGIQSLERTLAIVTEIQARDGARITDLASATGLSKSTVHKHLATLHREDLVVKRDESYELGLRFLDLGAHVRGRIEGAHLIREKLRELAVETDETAQFAVEEHGRGVVCFRETGRRGVFTKGRVGKRFFVHQTAAGKAMLSKLPEPYVRAVIDRNGLPAATDATITDEAELFEELEAIRERGFSYNHGESTKGLRAVAVPITAPDERVLGAFAVAGPSHRLEGDRFTTEIPNLIKSVVNELELNLAHA
ncbi:IclR family transcriptional regulator [Natronomonas sp. EA1]|uniref:IclR family transcriptional regulator n=1 Tax=Natronomonas sp. EA1 TaxID=3421655 RepID=UPI003EB6F1C5